MQKAGAVERRGDGREQGFKAPTKFKIWWPAIGSGLEAPTILLPSALCPLPSAFFTTEF